jgi:hypothetical protein
MREMWAAGRPLVDLETADVKKDLLSREVVPRGREWSSLIPLRQNCERRCLDKVCACEVENAGRLDLAGSLGA